MFREYGNAGRMHRPPPPLFHHDPEFIRFRSWTAMVLRQRNTPPLPSRNLHTLPLDDVEGTLPVSIPAGVSVALKNYAAYDLINLVIVAQTPHREVFYAKDLPRRLTLQLKFLKPGPYRMIYTLAKVNRTLERGLNLTETQTAPRPAPQPWKNEGDLAALE